MKIRIHASTVPTAVAGSVPGLPLWQLAPTRDSAGQRLTDFMMLIPRLRSRPLAEIERTSREIQAVLALHPDVVFADLNLKLNLLWMSFAYRGRERSASWPRRSGCGCPRRYWWRITPGLAKRIPGAWRTSLTRA